MEIQDLTDIFYGSTSYWVILSVLFAMFAGILILFRKRAINNANITDLKKKKANRIATKRLKYASQLMAANEHEKFYDEVLRTLWGYVSAKLNIPVERLSKDNISENLMSKDIDENTISMFIHAIDECEYNRYAPGDIKGNMNQTFETAMSAIIKIENTLSGSKKNSSKGFWYFLCYFVFVHQLVL